MRMSTSRFIILALVAVTVCSLLAAGCTPTPTPPALVIPTRTPRPPQPTQPPTFTAAAFELRASSTFAPTDTPIPFGLASTIEPPVAEGTAGLPQGFNPLTGLKISDASLLERRPLVIKITNFPRGVRSHQYGLNAADHIWEYYLEDELTRFVGVFYGKNVSQVGPIRSARPFDEHLLHMYKGILTFAYADRRLMDAWVADDKVAPYMVIQKPDNCPPMCRIGPKSDYNTLYTDTALLSQYVSERGTSNGRQKLEGLRFETGGFPAAGGEPAEHIDIRFSAMSYNYWLYQPGERRYYRWQDLDRVPPGDELYDRLIDSLDGSQVAADNIVLLFVPSDYIYVSTSTDVVQHDLKGSGPGFAIRDGRIFEVEWRREKPRDLVTLYFTNGRPYLLKPGNVWYEVLSAGSDFIKDKGYWRFTYYVPPVPTITPRYTETPTLYPLNRQP